MANTLSGSTSIAQDNTTVTYSDTTTYTSPLRSAVGVFISVYKQSSDGSESLITSTLDNVDPEITSSVVFDISQDGWYKIYQISVPDYNSGTSYSKYAAVFDAATDSVYISQSNGNIGQSLANPTYWVIQTNPSIIAKNKGLYNESTNIDSLVYNKVINVKTKEKRDIFSVTAALECCTDCNRDKQVGKFELLDIFTVALEAADTYSEYLDGEKIARRAEALFS